MTGVSTECGYFTNAKRGRDFERTFVEAFAHIQRQQITQLVSPENMLRYRHGRTWTSPANEHAFNGGMQTHSMEMTTPFQDLVDNRLSLISDALRALATSAKVQFTHMIYSGVSAAADHVGNTVNAKELGSTAEAFAQMLEKVEFSVGRDGQVSLPEMHVGSEAYDKLIKALNEAPPEFRERIERIKATKSEQALAREAERRAKFARYGG